jgi:uncharacterized membrane protein (UPF0127 family)
MKNSIQYIVIFIILLKSISVYPESSCIISIINNKGIKKNINAEIALTDYERQLGLMYRRSMGKNSGMLFVFPSEENLSFWMKNTYIPLSIAYLDKSGKIIDIQDMKPLDTSITYPSKYRAMYALEMNMGWFKENGITEGSVVLFNKCF